MKNYKHTFDSDLYAKVDRPAREITKIWYLKTYGIVLYDNSDKFGSDLIETGEDGNVIRYHEVQVSLRWKNNDYPFEKGLLMFNRKRKFLIENKEKPYILYDIKRDLTAMVYATGDAFENHAYEETKYHENGLPEKNLRLDLKYTTTIRNLPIKELTWDWPDYAYKSYTKYLVNIS